jgi:hypothetical protein
MIPKSYPPMRPESLRDHETTAAGTRMGHMSYPALLAPDGITRLREPFTSAEYTSTGIANRLGRDATAALARDDHRAALSATKDRDRLALHQEAQRGPNGWEVSHQSLVQIQGPGWSEEIDPTLLALIGGCDGTVPLRTQLAVLAAAYGAEPETLEQVASVVVPHLVARGFIEPVDAQ